MIKNVQLIENTCHMQIYNHSLRMNRFASLNDSNDDDNDYNIDKLDKNDNLLRILHEKLIYPKHMQFGMPFFG